MSELMVALISSLMKNGVNVPANDISFDYDSGRFTGDLDTIILDFSEHDKMVAEEKDEKIRELKRQIEDLEAIIADGKKPDISVSENGVSVGCECGGYHLTKKRIEELEDRHQSDCIRINQLLTTIDVLTERYQKLREIHGL